MKGRCPHCGCSISEAWHRSYGLEKIDKGWVEIGIPVIGRVNFKRQSIAMVYVCEVANLPFLVVLHEAG
jgi:hypothetical protein